MKTPILPLLILLAAFLCVSCTTAPKIDGDNPESFLHRSDVINLPFRISDKGLIVVTAQIDEGLPVFMIVDTAATRSAVYEDAYRRLGLRPSRETVNVHGLVESGVRPEITLPFIILDGAKIESISVAVLEKFAKKSETSIEISGLIGLDILDNYYIFFDHDREVLSLIPTHYSSPTLPPSWAQITLKSNPYKDDGLPLKYFDMRVAGYIVPTLLDTGSEFNLANWDAIKHPQIRATRRKLKRKWKLSGAIGKFEPRLKVKLQELRGGQKFWNRKEFLVLNFESLNILGVNEQPFMIAGVDMLTNNTFWLDLDVGEIAFKPNADERAYIPQGSEYKIIVKPDL